MCHSHWYKQQAVNCRNSGPYPSFPQLCQRQMGHLNWDGQNRLHWNLVRCFRDLLNGGPLNRGMGVDCISFFLYLCFIPLPSTDWVQNQGHPRSRCSRDVHHFPCQGQTTLCRPQDVLTTRTLWQNNGIWQTHRL